MLFAFSALQNPKVYGSFHLINRKTGVYYSTINGFYYEDPSIRHSFYFIEVFNQSLTNLKIHSTGRLYRIDKTDSSGKYKLFDENCVYCLNSIGVGVF